MPIIGALPFNILNGTLEDATQVMANYNKILTDVNANAGASPVNADITTMTALATVSHAVAFVAISATALTLTGNLTFVGNGLKIIADMDTATLNNRFAFQTSNLNQPTSVEAIPNGTSQNSQFGAWAGTDRSSSAVVLIAINNATAQATISSIRTGVAPNLPLVINSPGECMRFSSTAGTTMAAPSAAVTTLTIAGNTTVAVLINGAAGLNCALVNNSDLATHYSALICRQAGGNVSYFGPDGSQNLLTGSTNGDTIIRGDVGPIIITQGGASKQLQVGTAGVQVFNVPFTSRGFADNAGGAAFSLDGNGRWNNNGATQPAVTATRTIDQTGAPATVVWNSKSIDNQAELSTATGIYTAGSTGWRVIMATMDVRNNTGAPVTAFFSIVVAGATIAAMPPFAFPDATTTTVTVIGLARMTSADQMTIATSQAFSANFKINAGGNNRLAVTQLF